jgi:hypothetical protein
MLDKSRTARRLKRLKGLLLRRARIYADQPLE